MTAEIDGVGEAVLFALAWVALFLCCAWTIWKPDAMPWHLVRDLRELWRRAR